MNTDRKLMQMALDVMDKLFYRKEGGLFMRDVTSTAEALRARLAQPERHLTLTKNDAGELVMVSWQDDEHRVLEVVWEKPTPPKGCSACGIEGIHACLGEKPAAGAPPTTISDYWRGYQQGKFDAQADAAQAEQEARQLSAIVQTLDEKLAQPEQKPVGYVYSEAWTPIKKAAINSDVPNGTPLYTAPPQREWKYDPMTGEPMIDGWPLYSALPKREWQGLTDEEILPLRFEFAPVDGWFQYARAIEAKLKEKNA